MSTEQPDSDQRSGAVESESASVRGKWSGRLLRTMLVLVIIVVSAGVSVYWLTHQPKAQRKQPQAQARLVEVTAAKRQEHRITISAMGTVVPARAIQLAAQVSGQVVAVSPAFVPGGRVEAGGKLLQIERTDYELAVLRRKSELTQAQGELSMEMGQQSVAQRELELLGMDVDQEDMKLLLRKPQLAMAQAAVAAARASLAQGELNLQRTEISTPFNAMVESRSVDLGAQVGVGTAVASLVGTDKYWVQVLVPMDQLRWIDIPDGDGKAGSTVRVYCEAAWGPEVFRVGMAEQLTGSLEPEGRMAQLLVAVVDPLGISSEPQQRHRLLLDSYVRVEIEGQKLSGVISVPRTALRDGKNVWVMQPDKTLGISKVKTVWSGNDQVFVTDGIDDGDLLITSDLAAPVAQMALRRADAADQDVTEVEDEAKVEVEPEAEAVTEAAGPK